jgi:GGDEF domain-containing protein
LPNTDRITTKKICLRIKKAFQDLNDRDNLPYPLNISLGYSTVDNKEDIYRCYEEADKNMYKNKESN